MSILTATMLATACTGDETVRAYGGADQIWTLASIDGVAFGSTATLTFPERGQIAGTAPCNMYRAEMSAPYPWFEVGPIAATRRACPDLAAETAFFDALSAMTLSEVSGTTLVLSTEDGREMVFTASE